MISHRHLRKQIEYLFGNLHPLSQRVQTCHVCAIVFQHGVKLVIHDLYQNILHIVYFHLLGICTRKHVIKMVRLPK
jgi:hypothetical protein